MDIRKYTGELGGGKQRKFTVLILFLSLLYTNGLSYVNWNESIAGILYRIVIFGLIVFLLFNGIKSKKCNFKNEILLLIFLPFLSCLNSNLLFGQSYIESARALLSNFIWVFYFVLKKYKVKESTILIAFFDISLLIVAIQVIQQITYPKAFFGIYSENKIAEEGLTDIAEQRNGIWRFYIGNNAYFTALILFAAISWAKVKSNSKLILIIILMMVSVYLTLTRQVIAACLLTVFFSLIIGRRNNGIYKGLIIGIVLLIFLYAYSGILFGALVSKTSDDMNDNNIRLLAAGYFWNESLTNPLVFLFGHGLPGRSGNYVHLMYQINTFLKFYTDDVGFIGMIYNYGLLYVLICYRILCRLFFTYKRIVPLYVRLFVIFSGSMSIMIFPMSYPISCLTWTMILHISDLYINRSASRAHFSISKNNE